MTVKTVNINDLFLIQKAMRQGTALTNWDKLSSPVAGLSLHHFTDANGVNGIIDKKEIWATHIKYMNDQLEYKYGLDLLHKVITDEISKEKDPELAAVFSEVLTFEKKFEGSQVFCVSFCERNDLYNLWKIYGSDGNGFCLSFNAKELSMEIENRRGPDLAKKAINKNTPGVYWVGPKKVLYSRVSQEQYIIDYLNDIRTVYAQYHKQSAELNLVMRFSSIGYISEFLFCFKSDFYEGEKEWRILGLFKSPSEKRKGGMTKKVGIDLLAAKSCIKPYAKLRLSNFDAQLESITRGPVTSMLYPDQDGIRWLLERNNLDIPIKDSEVKFR